MPVVIQGEEAEVNGDAFPAIVAVFATVTNDGGVDISWGIGVDICCVFCDVDCPNPNLSCRCSCLSLCKYTFAFTFAKANSFTFANANSFDAIMPVDIIVGTVGVGVDTDWGIDLDDKNRFSCRPGGCDDWGFDCCCFSFSRNVLADGFTCAFDNVNADVFAFVAAVCGYAYCGKGGDECVSCRVVNCNDGFGFGCCFCFSLSREIVAFSSVDVDVDVDFPSILPAVVAVAVGVDTATATATDTDTGF